jgi:hypothetical protein
MCKNLIAVLLIFISVGVKAQNTNNSVEDDSLKYVQMTGIVISDSMERIPFTKVIDLSTKRGVIADYYGYFAMVVHPGDTIQFSSIGYKKKLYIVSDTTTLGAFSLVQILKYDTIMSNPVDVYPWPSKEAFAEEFVNMDSPNDGLKRARKRLTPQEMAFVGTLMESDGLSSYNTYQQQYYQNQYTRGQGPQNNLLNPSAWAEFINGVGTGKYRISN